MTKNITIIILVLLFYSCKTIRIENYYLPQYFEGNVAIIYKSSGSNTSDTQNWHIPNNGILRTEHNFSPGNYVINYYQKNSSNTYDTLRYNFTNKHTIKNEVVFPRTLTFKKLNRDEVFTVNTFYVGKKKAEELEKDRFFFEKKLEEMLLNDNVEKGR